MRTKTITCACGVRVECRAFTNTCHNCGADYNSCGSRLAPRSQWGEDTGESFTSVDIAQMNSPDYDPFDDDRY